MAVASTLPDLRFLARSTVWKRSLNLHSQYFRGASKPARLASFATMTHVKDHIALTDKERDLFDTLLAAVKHSNSGTVLRAAGGWVRDKLLDKESVDIDVALDNMLGKDFADKVNEYLRSTGQETRKSAVIQSNPDQSKHLETARMKITDIWIDLVNLRSETYTQDSRIPTMEFGTPSQDATRRDFTINSMFYNINEGTVEDFTGKGMDDLRAGIIRTPLPPQETFLDGTATAHPSQLLVSRPHASSASMFASRRSMVMHSFMPPNNSFLADPLRVLRAVRFGTRFGFTLESSLLDAAACDEVHTYPPSSLPPPLFSTCPNYP
jgi:hypothetical protein